MKNQLSRIAIVRTDKIGDMILTLPLIEQIKKSFPDSEVSLISASYTNDVTENLSFIDKIFNKDKYDNQLKNIFKEYKPNAIFFPRPRFDEIRDAFFAGIKYRIGSAYRWYSFLLNHKVKDHRKVSEYHEAKYNVRMLESFLKSQNFKNDESISQTTENKEKFNSPNSNYYFELPEIFYNPNIEFDNLLDEDIEPGIKPKGYFIIHPGSGGSARDWSAEKIGQLASLITAKYKLLPIISGTKSESEKCAIASLNCPNALNLCDKVSLKMLKPLIKKSKFLISNSTGIIHIAASLKTPVIGFYPNTPHLSAKRWGPYTEKRLIISPENAPDGTYNDDMNTISVNFAFEQILKTNFIENYD